MRNILFYNTCQKTGGEDANDYSHMQVGDIGFERTGCIRGYLCVDGCEWGEKFYQSMPRPNRQSFSWRPLK